MTFCVTIRSTTPSVPSFAYSGKVEFAGFLPPVQFSSVQLLSRVRLFVTP